MNKNPYLPDLFARYGDIMTTDEVAEVFKVGEEAILALISEGKLQATQFLGMHRLATSSVADFLQQNFPKPLDITDECMVTSQTLPTNGGDSSMRKATISPVKDGRIRVQITIGTKPNGQPDRIVHHFNPKKDPYASMKAIACAEELNQLYADGLIHDAVSVRKPRGLSPVTAPVAVPVVKSTPAPSSLIMYKGEPISGNTDFFTYGNYYIDEVNGARETTKEGYKGHLRKFNNFGFLQVPIGDLQERHGKKAIEWLAEFGKGAKPPRPAKLAVEGKPKTATTPRIRKQKAKPAEPAKNGTQSSEATVDDYIATLRMVAEQAVREGFLSENVFKGLEVPKTALDVVEMKLISPHVWDVFLEEAKAHDDLLYAYLRMMKALGTRPSEARALAYEQFDFDTGIVHIKWTIKLGEDGREGLGVTKENSNKKKKNMVKRLNNLLPDDLAVLEAYRKKQSSELGECKFMFMKNGDIVGSDFFSKPISKIQNKLIAEGKMKADDKFVAYNIRHTVITDMLKLGLSPLEVAKMVGTSVEMILKHYDHSQCSDAIKKKMQLMEFAKTLSA
jgi:excisionase family DNA binding protein